MDKNNSAEDDFLGDLANNDNEVDPLATQENEDLFPEDDTQTEEIQNNKPIPFAKDEKVQRYIERQIEKRLKTYQPTATETFKEEVSAGDPELVKAFEGIIGNDTPEKVAALKALENSLAKVDERATAKAIERLQQVQQESEENEAREIEEARDEIEDGFEDIENAYGIELTDRQKQAYKDFLLKVEPRGGYQEYPDFVETFEVFKNYVKAQRPSNSQAKALASRGMERSSTNDTPSLNNDFGKKPLWDAVDQMLGK